jgi:hypothetical protein
LFYFHTWIQNTATRFTLLHPLLTSPLPPANTYPQVSLFFFSVLHFLKKCFCWFMIVIRGGRSFYNKMTMVSLCLLWNLETIVKATLKIFTKYQFTMPIQTSLSNRLTLLKTRIRAWHNM